MSERLNIWTAAEPRVLEAAAGGLDRPVTTAREFAVTIIRPGVSLNGMHYPPAVLAAALPRFEGAAAFADHPTALDETRAGGRSLRDLVGVYHSVGLDETGAVTATLRVLPAAAWAADLIAQYVGERDAGRPVPPIGISADLLVSRRAANGGARQGGRRSRFEVLAIEAVNSADIVFRPSAGGTFDRILNSEEREVSENENTTTGDAERELHLIREARKAALDELLAAKLAASGLPEAAQSHVRERLDGAAFSAADVDAGIEKTRALLSAVQPLPIRGAGGARALVGRGSLEQFTTALELLFGVDVAESQRNVPRLSGIREAYLLLTGDHNFSGRPDPERALVREANETLLAQMDQVTANVMGKKLVQDYKAQPKWWEPVVVKQEINQIKQQSRILLNDFGALATVAENAAYANIAWGDSQEVYTPAKRGNLVYMSMEVIINDDTKAFTRIPKKLAAAAAVTINEFVSGLFTANAGEGSTMADASNVMTAARGNKGTDALDATSLAAGYTAMLKLTNSAGKRLGHRPRFLLVPPDLAVSAWTLSHSTLLPGTANNDRNFWAGVVEPVVVPNWIDVNNWYLMADPNQVECIELGFLNGREAPEILVQDDPKSGYAFTNDALVWKVRWIFGGGWLDYRGAYGAVVV